MATLITLLQLVLVGLAAWLMGLAVVKPLLPADLDEAYGTLIAPTVGYLVFCLVAFTLSATFRMPAATACWIAMAALGLAGLATQLRPEWRLRPAALARDLRTAAVLALPMALATLFPLFYLGAETYVGAVNPDFFAGLIDNEYLRQGHPVTSFTPVTRDTAYPVESIAGGISASARFASGLFALAINLALGVDMRAALSLAIGFFMLCLPLTLYFFCRVVMGFAHRLGRLGAWLIGMSAPIAMSYLYYYLGQNSGLPALPLVLASAYLMLTRPGRGPLVLCALLSNALFVTYFAMLPYALAPAGPLALYLLATRRLALTRAVALGAGFVAISAVFILGNLAATLESMQMWLGVIGASLQGSYFLDFLTESFFPYFFGIYNYQFSAWLAAALGKRAPATGFVIAMACLGAALWFVWRWARETPGRESRVFVLSALAIYTAVWALYSFSKQYGYAVFKMTSWLQFMLIPFMAYGIDRLWRRLPEARTRTAARWAVGGGLAICAAYAGLNLTATLVYGFNGLGRNTDTGYIVNHFGVSGNRDYLELKDAVARHVKPGESVGLLFTDSIRNWWTSYYLRGMRQSILSHELMPGEDENLPEIESGMALDYYGNVRRGRADYFHGGASDQYYLTAGPRDINREIASQDLGAPPVWENGTFRLYRASDAHDILLTGRGFYRIEYFKPNEEYFFPQVMRWSAQGGEFFLLRPRHPGKPYRLAFDAIVGYQNPSDSRTLELFLNGRKIQEAVIHHSARFVSEPFVPDGGANKLVVRIKERNTPLPRRFVLWNRDIPTDYRRVNMAFANARIVPPDSAPPAAPPLGAKVPFLKGVATAQAFNGLQLDGWFGDTAEMVFAVPEGARQVRVEAFLPGNLGFKFPFAVHAGVNGREAEHRLEAPGDFALDLPLQPGESLARIAIRPSQNRYLGDANVRFKVVRTALRLDGITFR